MHHLIIGTMLFGYDLNVHDAVLVWGLLSTRNHLVRFSLVGLS